MTNSQLKKLLCRINWQTYQKYYYETNFNINFLGTGNVIFT
jgi:hypothetical protein